MATNTDIKIKITTVSDTKGTVTAKKNIETLGKKTKEANQVMQKSTKSTMQHLTSLGSSFRYLSLVAGTAMMGLTVLLKSTVQESMKMQESLIAVQLVARRLGYDIDRVTKIVYDFADTGFFTVESAAGTLSRLLATGLNIDLIEKSMWKMADVAAFLRKGMISVEQSMMNTGEGLMSLRDIKYESIGMFENLQTAIARLAKADGKLTKNLNLQEKQYYGLMAIWEQAEKMQGGFALLMNSTAGTVAQLTAKTRRLSAAIGDTLQPVVMTLSLLLGDFNVKMREWVKINSDLVMKIVLVTTGIITFVTVLAATAAILPMIVVGIGAMAKMFWAILPGSIFMTVKALIAYTGTMTMAATVTAIVNIALLALLATMAIVIWRTGFLQNVFGRTMGIMKDKIKSVQDQLDKMEKLFDNSGDAAEEFGEDTIKALKKIGKQVEKENKNFTEALMELVKKHSKTIDSLEADLAKLDKDQKKYLEDQEEDYEETMGDMEREHKDKLFELERDLREEVSLGLWANQEKIRDLQEAIAKENEEYDRQHQRKIEGYQEDTSEYNDSVEEKRKTIIEQLNEEYDLRLKYQADYTAWREFAFRDEIQKLKDSHQDKLDALEEQKNETIDNAKKTSEGINEQLANLSIPDLTSSLNDQFGAFAGAGETMGKSFSREFMDIVKEEWRYMADVLKDTFSIKSLGAAAWKFMTGGIAFPSLEPHASGGWTSPMETSLVGERGPEIVNLPGGSRITPNNEMGNTTININNPIVREDEDINRIAEAVNNILGRRTELSRLGGV